MPDRLGRRRKSWLLQISNYLSHLPCLTSLPPALFQEQLGEAIEKIDPGVRKPDFFLLQCLMYLGWPLGNSETLKVSLSVKQS